MMQEEELVIKDEFSTNAAGGRKILPLSVSESGLVTLKKYKYCYFEIVAALVMTLSTISGGLLEGYSSPAIPSMLQCTSDVIIRNFSVENMPVRGKNISTKNIDIEDHDSTILCNFTQNMMVNSSNELSLINCNENVTSIDVNINNGSDENDYTNNSSTMANVNDTQKEILIRGCMNSNNTTIHITKEEASWFGSLLLLGACLGSLGSPYVIQYGRRHAVLFSALPRLIGWIMIASATSVSIIYAGRILTGFSVGLVTAAAPIYISEIAHQSSRGSLSYLVQFGVNTGIFLASLFGTFLEWRGLAVVGAISVVIYFLATLSIPNSPSWLVFRGRENEARKSLSKLRPYSYNVEEELQQIVNLTNSTQQNESISWLNILKEKRCRLPLFLVLLVTAINKFSGYNAIITYCASFLQQAAPSVSEYWAAVAVSLIQIIGTGVAIPLVDRVGRRKLLLVSVICMGVSLCTLAICEKFVLDHKGVTWLIVLLMMFYVGSYSIGIGPLTWVLLGEMFPLDARDKASAVVATFNWFSAFVITKTYFGLELFAGITGTCILYGLVCVAGAGAIYFFVPETRGRTLAEIESHFSYQQHSWQPFSASMDGAFSSILEQDGAAASVESYSTFH